MQVISKYITSNKFEVVSKELTLYTSRLLGKVMFQSFISISILFSLFFQGTNSSLEVVEGKYVYQGKPVTVAVKKLGAQLKDDVEAALQQ